MASKICPILFKFPEKDEKLKELIPDLFKIPVKFTPEPEPPSIWSDMVCLTINLNLLSM